MPFPLRIIGGEGDSLHVYDPGRLKRPVAGTYPAGTRIRIAGDPDVEVPGAGGRETLARSTAVEHHICPPRRNRCGTRVDGTPAVPHCAGNTRSQWSDHRGMHVIVEKKRIAGLVIEAIAATRRNGRVRTNQEVEPPQVGEPVGIAARHREGLCRGRGRNGREETADSPCRVRGLGIERRSPPFVFVFRGLYRITRPPETPRVCPRACNNVEHEHAQELRTTILIIEESIG